MCATAAGVRRPAAGRHPGGGGGGRGAGCGDRARAWREAYGDHGARRLRPDRDRAPSPGCCAGRRRPAGSMGRPLPGVELASRRRRAVRCEPRRCRRSSPATWNDRPGDRRAAARRLVAHRRPRAARTPTGVLWYAGSRRRRDLVIAGYRIGPGEVETALRSHPAVLRGARRSGCPTPTAARSCTPTWCCGRDAVAVDELAEERCDSRRAASPRRTSTRARCGSWARCRAPPPASSAAARSGRSSTRRRRSIARILRKARERPREVDSLHPRARVGSPRCAATLGAGVRDSGRVMARGASRGAARTKVVLMLAGAAAATAVATAGGAGAAATPVSVTVRGKALSARPLAAKAVHVGTRGRRRRHVPGRPQPARAARIGPRAGDGAALVHAGGGVPRHPGRPPRNQPAGDGPGHQPALEGRARRTRRLHRATGRRGSGARSWAAVPRGPGSEGRCGTCTGASRCACLRTGSRSSAGCRSSGACSATRSSTCRRTPSAASSAHRRWSTTSAVVPITPATTPSSPTSTRASGRSTRGSEDHGDLAPARPTPLPRTCDFGDDPLTPAPRSPSSATTRCIGGQQRSCNTYHAVFGGEVVPGLRPRRRRPRHAHDLDARPAAGCGTPRSSASTGARAGHRARRAHHRLSRSAARRAASRPTRAGAVARRPSSTASNVINFSISGGESGPTRDVGRALVPRRLRRGRARRRRRPGNAGPAPAPPTTTGRGS